MTGEQTPGTNLRISHISVFLASVGQHVPLKEIMGFAKFGERKLFFAKMPVPT